MLNGLTTDYMDFGTVTVVDLDFIMGKVSLEKWIKITEMSQRINEPEIDKERGWNLITVLCPNYREETC